eukprot:6177955-Pleurochrysis_carterae.AAC.3
MKSLRSHLTRDKFCPSCSDGQLVGGAKELSTAGLLCASKFAMGTQVVLIPPLDLTPTNEAYSDASQLEDHVFAC